MTRDEIFARVREMLTETFEVKPELITPGAQLFQELDLDSIDAIDMVVRLEEWTGRRVPEEALRTIRTVDDVVSLAEAHLAQARAEGTLPAAAAAAAGGSGGGGPDGSPG